MQRHKSNLSRHLCARTFSPEF